MLLSRTYPIENDSNIFEADVTNVVKGHSIKLFTVRINARDKRTTAVYLVPRSNPCLDLWQEELEEVVDN